MSRELAAAVGIHPAAINAWLSLRDALDRMTDNRQRPVCEQRPDQWTSDASQPDRADAAHACTYCPAAPACLAFALANRERTGVWGGSDFTPKGRR